MMNEIIELLVGLGLICLFMYGVFNAVLFLSCYSIEGKPYWNKVVVACAFNDTPIIINQVVMTQDGFCFKNGKQINCSIIGD